MRKSLTSTLGTLVICGILGGGVVGCGDDGAGNNNDNLNTDDAAVQNDAAPQNDAVVQNDAAIVEVQGCTGDPITSPGEMGACCNYNSDCLSDRCIGGWCSDYCDYDEDCPATAPGPFPTGTPMRCNAHSITGGAQYCIPGSLQPCAGENDGPCPEGESCIMAYNDQATVNDLGRMERGVCVTSMAQPGVLAAGERCDDSTNPTKYQCETPGLFRSGCYLRRCYEACDVENPTNTCPTGMACHGPLAFKFTGYIMSGAGVCTGTPCGQAEFTGDDEDDVRIPGRNSECAEGQFCYGSTQTYGVDGASRHWMCIPSDPALGQPGDACEHASKFDQACDNASLCIQDAAHYFFAGAICSDDEDCASDEVCVDHATLPQSRCSPKPDPGFCSQGCRTDADCADMPNGPAICLTQWSLTLVNGEKAFSTWCYPTSGIDPNGLTSCDTSADCDVDVGEVCLRGGLRSTLKYCMVSIDQDPSGADCSANGVADCQAQEACVEDSDASSFHCTAYLVNGDACEPAVDNCIGACADIEYEEDDNGSPTNTFCMDYCSSNVDCHSSQVCDWWIRIENDPATDVDDVAYSACRNMRVRSGAGCAVPGDCTNGDACDTNTGRCYTVAASWGDACAEHSDCPVYGLCNTKVTGGLCYRPGCDSAAGNTGCDNTGACSDDLPVGRCLEDCATTTDCSRSGEGFTCVSGACVP